jgi:uncharacterized membrane protein
METVEIIGLAASVLVLISFLMREIRIIRIISIFGCVFWVVYGVWLGALSVWLLNGILILVHIFFLIRMRKRKGSTPAEGKATKVARASNGRLQKLDRDSFNKKGFKSLQWFISRDFD